MSGRRPDRERRSLGSALKRLVVPTLVAVAAYYAVFGGEYSIFELRAARAAVVEEQARLEDVRLEIDSLRTMLDLLEHDSATIERIAREDFGMLRDGEALYRFADTEDADERESPPAR